MVRATLVFGERHDVLGFFQVGLSLQVSSASGDEVGVLSEEREDIQVGIVQDGILAVLGIDGAQIGLELAVGLHDLDHGFLRVLRDVSSQLLVRSRQLRKVGHGGDEEEGIQERLEDRRRRNRDEESMDKADNG